MHRPIFLNNYGSESNSNEILNGEIKGISLETHNNTFIIFMVITLIRSRNSDYVNDHDVYKMQLLR